MKVALTFLAIFGIALAQVTDIEQCHCKNDFVARKDRDGQVKCFGLITRNIAPCNLVEKPRCSCNGATGILHDATGIWCAVYEKGQQKRKWECENKDDWARFNQEHPNEKP